HMSNDTTLAADAVAKPMRQKYGAFNTPGRYMAHVALAPEDLQFATDVINQIAEITSQRPSLSVFLRAGIAAMADDVKQVKAERQRKPGEHSRAETNLLWSLARSARLTAGGPRAQQAQKRK